MKKEQVLELIKKAQNEYIFSNRAENSARNKKFENSVIVTLLKFKRFSNDAGHVIARHQYTLDEVPEYLWNTEVILWEGYKAFVIKH